jgi:hypothetical protein
MGASINLESPSREQNWGPSDGKEYAIHIRPVACNNMEYKPRNYLQLLDIRMLKQAESSDVRG